MDMFIPYVLVCLAGQSPYECTRQTAQDVVMAEPAKNEIMCGFYAQAALAGTSIGRGLRDGEWVKIICERVKT
jgi:hypothetical protein